MVSNGLPITSLLDIGANIAANTVLPVVDVASNTSNKANLGQISNYILNSNLDANLGNLGVSGNITLTNNTILEDSVAPAAFKITTDTNVGVIINSGNTQAWAFDVYGNLTFPDSSVQNTAWIGTVVAANVIGLGNISSANFDGNSSNVLLGDGTFTALPSISGNIANTNLDGNSSNVLYGNGTFAAIQGDGGNLSNIVGGNVSGEVGYAAVANSVDVANVVGIGNIATVNLDGNVSNVLLGDGTFSTVPSLGNIASINIDGNASNVLLGNGVFSSVQGDGGNLSNIAGGNVSGEVGYAATANSVDVANVSGIGNIATVNLDGNASNVLLGDGTFSSVPGLGNIASINIDGNASNVLLGNGVFSSVQGDGGNLSNIAGGNVSGEVGYAATANSVAGANVSGEVGYAAVANSVAASNVSGLGNISTLNTDGNASNILYGNGVFAAAGGGGGGDSISNGTSNVSFSGVNGNVNLVSAGNTTLVVTGTGANITGTLNSTGNLTAANANLGNLATANFFQGDGGLLTNITVAGGTAIVNGNSNVTVAANGNVTVGVSGNANVMKIDGANVTLGANGYLKLVCSPVIDEPIAIGGRFDGIASIASEVSIGNVSNTTAGAFYTSLGTFTGFYTQEADGAGNVFFSSLDTDTLSMVSNLGIGGNNIQLKNSPYPKFTLNANTCNFDIDTLFASKSSSIVYMQDNNTFAYLSMGPYTMYMDDGTGNTGIWLDITSGLSVTMYDVDGNTVYDITGSNSNLAGTFTANTVKSNIAFQMPLYASDAARDAAIPTPAQGMMVFNQTGNVFQGYTGTTWANLN